jgi:hypothetical protein
MRDLQSETQPARYGTSSRPRRFLSSSIARVFRKLMKSRRDVTSVPSLIAFASASLIALGTAAAVSATDKYSLKVPNGLAFSEFRGYERWSVIAISESKGKIAVILGNPVIIDAYKSGIPANGKPFPDGSKMAKIHWNPKQAQTEPNTPTVPGTQHDVDFMVKDRTRFADSGGWGYGAFEYDAPSGAFVPATSADTPPQEHDAKCGLACHTIAKNRDYVFTDYASR